MSSTIETASGVVRVEMRDALLSHRSLSFLCFIFIFKLFIILGLFLETQYKCICLQYVHIHPQGRIAMSAMAPPSKL